jgi:oligopeptidase A
MNNALTRCGQPPQFDAITNDLIEPTMTALLGEANEKLTALEGKLEPTWDGSIMALHRMGEQLGFAWGIVGHLMSVKNNDELRAIHDKLQPQMIAFGMRAGQSQPTYNALTQLKEGPLWHKLDEGQQRVVDNELLGMKHTGIGLTGDDQDNFNAWQQRLGELSTQFMNHVLDSTKAYELIVTHALFTARPKKRT